MQKHILVIEDDQVLRRLMAQYLRELNHEVTGVGSWQEADQFLGTNEPNLIITDGKLPDGSSLKRLPELAKSQPVIYLTAYGSVRDAVQAMKAGAFDYLVKPVSPEELMLLSQRALDDAELRQEHQFCMRRLKAKEGSGSFMIGVSEPLDKVQELIDAVAPTDMTVLVQGDSGTGKELVARAIHERSERAKRNFVAVDCCTLQEKLFESELFGHEKGAFTGADRQKKGLIEGADGGTLFLDEIGEIDASLQAKLLRVLETGRFRRLGGNKDLVANTRVVAATNRNLEQMSERGEFRSDLYYRLNGFAIETPPLRDRREDIPYLADHFIQHHNFSRRIDKKINGEAMRQLIAYDWPGNVRELKNVVERAIILSRDKTTIRIEHLAFGNSSKKRNGNISLNFDKDPSLDELEAAYLRMQLEKFSGHRAKVAEVLKVSERNVYRLIKRHGLAKAF